MEHLSQEELRARLDKAHELVEVGARYAHFKHLEQAYTVVSLAIREDTQDVCVIYKAEYGEEIPFIRTLESFISPVELVGVTTLRFHKL